MADYGVSRAFVFCLDEPDRRPAFRAANDRTLAFAERSNGRLIPFVRLDLNEAPIEEARAASTPGPAGSSSTRGRRASTRRPAARARVRARRRATGADPDPRRSRPAADRRRARRARRANPDATLIVAHAGIADMAHSPRAMAGRKRVFFDTSTWSAIDLLDFYRQVPPEQVVYASDFPYGQQPLSLFIVLKTARLAGYDDDAAARAPRRERQPDRRRRGPPRADRAGRASPTIVQSMQQARIHQYISMATPLLWTRQQDTLGVLGLAMNTCAERNGHPRGASTGSTSCSRPRTRSGSPFPSSRTRQSACGGSGSWRG